MNERQRKAFWFLHGNGKKLELGKLSGERELVGFDKGRPVYANVRILDKKELEEMSKSDLRNKRLHFKDRYVKW
jgi:myosin-crossreactive antigen